MRSYGAFEAKTHLGQLLDHVANGESIIIKRHGKAMAIIVPFSYIKDDKDSKVSHTIDTIRKIRKNITLGENLSIKQLINEGRK